MKSLSFLAVTLLFLLANFKYNLVHLWGSSRQSYQPASRSTLVSKISLFDGKTGSGWRAYNGKGFPAASWKIANGELISIKTAGDVHPDDLQTESKYTNFILDLDFKLTTHANSGILYGVVEQAGKPSWNSAPEYQVLDDPSYKLEGLKEVQMSGSAYDLYPAKPGALKPLGEWNHARVIVRGKHIEHWLNGKEVVDYTLESPDWLSRVKESKFKDMPEYGRAGTGYIALQNHHEEVHFKNIKLEKLN